jgi:hypothetical protein
LSQPVERNHQPPVVLLTAQPLNRCQVRPNRIVIGSGNAQPAEVDRHHESRHPAQCGPPPKPDPADAIWLLASQAPKEPYQQCQIEKDTDMMDPVHGCMLQAQRTDLHQQQYRYWEHRDQEAAGPAEEAAAKA